MIWEPFALAVLFGLAISATIYFIFVWPQREPGEGDELDGAADADAAAADDDADDDDDRADEPPTGDDRTGARDVDALS